MDGGSIEKAVERIEAALARIENAAQQSVDDAAGLEARHVGLKQAVANSLRQIDDLIAGQQG